MDEACEQIHRVDAKFHLIVKVIMAPEAKIDVLAKETMGMVSRIPPLKSSQARLTKILRWPL